MTALRFVLLLSPSAQNCARLLACAQYTDGKTASCSINVLSWRDRRQTPSLAVPCAPALHGQQESLYLWEGTGSRSWGTPLTFAAGRHRALSPRSRDLRSDSTHFQPRTARGFLPFKMAANLNLALRSDVDASVEAAMLPGFGPGDGAM